MLDNPFDRSGLASLDDLAMPLWNQLFSTLESIQSDFIAMQPHDPAYAWPKDPLHDCIRAWEYPFVYKHLQSIADTIDAHSLPRIVDLGSGATFFPFAIAQLGYNVTAVDADPAAKATLDKAAGKISTGRGSVTSLLSDARSVALESDSVDAVYCVSVLEHIPDFPAVIAEVQRILRPGGIFILTFDVDLRGNWELGPASYTRLMSALSASFCPVYPEKVIHPLRVLTSDNSPYPMYSNRPIRDHLVAPLRDWAQSTLDRLLSRPLSHGRLLVGTYGACLQRHGTSSAKYPTVSDSYDHSRTANA